MFSALLIWTLALVLSGLAYARPGDDHKIGFRLAVDQFKDIMPRVILTILTAGFLGSLIPQELMASWLGANTGFVGILVASVAGGLVPGGPMLSFPIAVVLLNTGAGIPQLTAFLAAWSVFAVHRMISYEIPLMGWRFSMVRLVSSLALPVVSGLLAWLLVSVTGLDGEL
ncbi:MAG: hypothetical protein ACRD1X_05610 [Vicinamibacteria bacterium]